MVVAVEDGGADDDGVADVQGEIVTGAEEVLEVALKSKIIAGLRGIYASDFVVKSQFNFISGANVIKLFCS
jgi:hypothetical protein